MSSARRWSLRRLGLGRRATPPDVTVAILTLNRADRLAASIRSVLAQDHPSFEVLVVNGPSTDGTADLLASMVSEGLRIRVTSCPVAQVGAARNVGLRESRGSIVAFIDDDAVAAPTWLTTMTAPFADPTVVAAGGPVFDVPLGRVDWRLCTCTRLGQPDVDAPGPIDRYLGPGADPFPYFAGCNSVYRRADALAVGGVDPDLHKIYDDVDLAAKLVDAGGRMAYVDEVLIDHDRAVNALRDDQQVLRDPFYALRDRVVFVARVRHRSLDDQELTDRALSWARDWGGEADRQLAAGQCTPEQHRWFLDRANEGATVGLQVGLESA
jgi:glycogen synthase